MPVLSVDSVEFKDHVHPRSEFTNFISSPLPCPSLQGYFTLLDPYTDITIQFRTYIIPCGEIYPNHCRVFPGGDDQNTRI